MTYTRISFWKSIYFALYARFSSDFYQKPIPLSWDNICAGSQAVPVILELEKEIFRQGSFRADEDHLDRICRDIEREFIRRGLWTRAEAASWERESQHVWMRRIAYGLVTRLIRQGDTEVLFDRIDRYRTSARGRVGDLNIFQSGLKAIFAHRPKAFTARDQERYGEQLMFAFRHFVPPPFLEGFLSQTHRHRMASKDGLVPLFVDWIDEGLSDVDEEEGDYRLEFLKGLSRQVRKVKKERKRRANSENRDWAT